MTNLERATLAVCIVFACVAALMLAGCEKTQPPPPAFVTEARPVLPAECFAAGGPVELLPEDRDADARTAARDAAQLTDALALERYGRRACAARLRALFPGQEPQ